MSERLIPQFPHCDPRVLHAPGECEFCDAHPEWQELRTMWNIAFTGHSYDKNGKPAIVDEYRGPIQPCPAEVARGMGSINSWGGNVPAKEPPKVTVRFKDGVTIEGEVVKVGTEPTFGKRVTLSGKPADPDYEGGAPQDINPASGQHKDYWVLAPEEIAKGLVRPVRRSYRHVSCGSITSMGQEIAESYARDPKFYGATFCAHCMSHYPVGEDGEFVWLDDGTKVGT